MPLISPISDREAEARKAQKTQRLKALPFSIIFSSLVKLGLKNGKIQHSLNHALVISAFFFCCGSEMISTLIWLFFINPLIQTALKENNKSN